MKKFIISALVLSSAIMTLGSYSAKAMENNSKMITNYSFRVAVDNDRPGRGGNQQKVTNYNYALNDNTSIKFTSGKESSARLYSRIVTADTGKSATDEDYFTSGGWSKMAYTMAGGQAWNGFKLGLQVRSNNAISAPVDVMGKWQADER